MGFVHGEGRAQASGISMTGTLSPQGSGLTFSGNYTINAPGGPIQGTVSGRQISPVNTLLNTSGGVRISNIFGTVTNANLGTLSGPTLNWTSGNLSTSNGSVAVDSEVKDVYRNTRNTDTGTRD